MRCFCTQLQRLALILWVLYTPAFAVSDGAPQSRDMLLVASARSNGMGEMTSILDDGPVALWWNPGMLSLDARSRLELTHSKLAEGLADDISLRTVTLTGSTYSRPFRFGGGIGYTRVDLGESDIINEHGELIGSFSSGDRLYNLGVGGSAFDAFSVGVALEYTDSELSPAIRELGIDDGAASAWSYSIGFGLSPRFYFGLPGREEDQRGPTFAFGRENLERNEDSGRVRFLVNPVFGVSWLHRGGEKMVYNDQTEPESLPRQRHVGYGFRFGLEAGHSDRFLDWRRLLSAEFQYGREEARNQVHDRGETIEHAGSELVLGHILSLRWGRVEHPEGRIQDTAGGWGFGLEEALPFGVRFDYARIPQSEGLPQVKRYALSLSADPDRLLGR